VITWTLRIAWLAAALIAAVPVLGRWLDPAPVLDLTARGTPVGVISLVFDVVTAAGHRSWMLPAVIALSGLVLVLSGAVFAWLSFHHAPWPQRRAALWPLLGLGIALLACAVLDDYLPEFFR